MEQPKHRKEPACSGKGRKSIAVGVLSEWISLDSSGRGRKVPDHTGPLKIRSHQGVIQSAVRSSNNMA